MLNSGNTYTIVNNGDTNPFRKMFLTSNALNAKTVHPTVIIQPTKADSSGIFYLLEKPFVQVGTYKDLNRTEVKELSSILGKAYSLCLELEKDMGRHIVEHAI